MNRFFALSLPCLMTACLNVGPDYEAPLIELPEAHASDLASIDESQSMADGEIDLVTWWSTFEDPLLTELIERAAATNFDLRAAVARVSEVEAVLGVERAKQGPRANLSAAYTRSGISKNTQFGLFPGQDRESNDHTAGIGASWEIDIWGRSRRMVEAANAELEARLDNHAAVRVSMAARVADAYLRLREMQSREAIALENIDVLVQSLGTTSARFEAGLIEELDVFRARTELETARSLLPEAQRGRAGAATEIELLLGVEPASLAELLALAPDARTTIPSPHGRLGEQIPADLLRRRPDLRSAERTLAAQTARVGIATAALYPSFTLLGDIGLQSETLGKLFDSGSGTHRFGPSFSMPFLSGGGLRAKIRVADALVEQALVSYESTVLIALHEVDSAANGIGFESARVAALERAQREAEASLVRSKTLYDEGLTSLDAVLDARRALFGIQDSHAQARSASARAYVDLYRALGGGWPGATE
ncbi:MAG: multidrug efflux system outer membrane protein [Planctomycetota bacterium]|jgi:multidrug efflux system outer membrane protein